MIRFSCKNCGQRFSVPEAHAGKKGKCPKCKSIVIIPRAKTTISASNQRESGELKVSSKNSVYDSTLLDVPKKDKVQNQPINEYTVEEGIRTAETEPVGKCKLPWIIDIFLYPTTISGIIHLVIFSFLPQKLLPLFSLGYWFSPPILGLGFLVIYMGYFLFCLSDYIYESANGNRRAPESKISPNILLHIEELLFPILNMFICVVVCFGPPLAYSIITKRIDFIFWLLVAYGNLFLPMVLLAVVMFDSFSVLNPIFIVGSIFKVFLRYFGFVLLFCSLSGLIALLAATLLRHAIFGYIFSMVCIYLVMVTAHLLGRFYWWHKDKLAWGI